MYCGVDTDSPEWKKLSSNTEGVGLFEAVKDAMFRADGVARPVEDVVRSIIKENPSRALEYKDRFPQIAEEFLRPEYVASELVGTNGPLGSEIDLYIKANLDASLATSAIDVFGKESESSSVTDALNEFIGTLTDNFGNQVGVNFITAEQAKEMHAAQGKNYNGQKGFFNNGAIYFVSKNITRKDVFHEFSHPFIKSLRLNNKRVYDNLIAEVLSTEEGSLLFQEALFDNLGLSEDSPYVQDELLARALTEKYMLGVKQEAVSGGFMEAIKNIFYRLRQMLRKVFGKSINLDKLSENTTLQEAMEMILGDKISINKEQITEQDVFDYMTEQDAAIDDLLRLGPDSINKQISATYTAAAQTIERLKGSYNINALLNVIKDAYSKNELETIKKNLADYSYDVIDTATDIQEQMEKASVRARIYVSNLRRLKNIMGRVNEDARKKTKEAVDPKTSIDAMYALNNYKEFANYWSNYIGFIKELIDSPENNEYIGTDSPLYNLVNSIESEISKLNKELNKVNRAAIGPILYEQLAPMAQAIDDKYARQSKYLEDMIAKADGNKKKGLEKDLANLKEKYETVRLTPEKFEMILSGDLGDAGQINSLLEGYLHNQDPVTASFAMFTKNALADVDLNFSKTQKRFNDTIGPLMRQAGLDNPLKPWAVGEATTYLDKSFTVNDNGRVEEYLTHSFLAPVKDYRLFTAQKEQELDDMRNEANKSQDKAKINAWRKAKADYRKYKVKYFWQEYDPAVYEPDFEIEETEEGREAREQYNAKWGEINAIDKTFYSDPADYKDALIRKQQLNKELSSMLSSKNDDNTPKPEREALKAELLRKWINDRRQFRVRILRQGAFQTAITDFMQNLVNSGVDPTSPEYDSAVKTWIDENTQVKFIQEYEDKVKAITDQIKAIKNKYPQEARDTMSEDQQYLNDIKKQYRDPETGELLGKEVPDDIVDKVREAQLRLNESRKNKNLSVLSEEDSEFYTNIQAKFEHNKNNPTNKLKITQDEIDEYQRIRAILQPVTMTPGDKQALKVLYNSLRELRVKQVTPQYLDVWNNLLQSLDTDDLYSALNSRVVTTANIDLILENLQLLQSLVNQGDANGTPEEVIQYEAAQKLKNFIEKNHVRNTIYDSATKTKRQVYEALDIWRETVPTDETSYMQTTYQDLNGNEVSIPNRAPSGAYWSSVVDPKYKTPFEVGRTINNGGRGSKNWLPRSKEDDAPADSPFINEAYYDVRANDPNLFNLLEALKRLHLDVQDKKPRGSRLYLDVPRFRIESGIIGGSIEQYRDAKNMPKRWWQNARDFFKPAEDDVDTGVLNPAVQKGLAMGDMFDDDNDGIPVHGIGKIESNNVSLEVTNTILRYAYSMEMQKKLLEINPIAKALKDSLRDPRTGNYKTIDPIQQMNKKNAVQSIAWLDDKISKRRGKKGVNLRAKNIDNFYEWVYQGKNTTGFGSQKWIVNLTNKLFKRASLGFFGLNIDSAVVNYFDAIIQNNIEAAAGKYMNMYSYQKGLARASSVMGALSWYIYHDEGERPVDLQVSFMFDPGQGTFKKHLGRDLTRNIARDAAEMTWLTSTRQWLDMQAQMSVLWGMLSHKQIPQMVDGQQVMINYADAWETKNGVAVLKEGIDLEYGAPINHVVDPNETLDSIAAMYNVSVDRLKEYNRIKDGENIQDLDKKIKENFVISKGTEFKAFRNRVQGVITNVNGAFAALDQPEANRYVIFRYINFLQKYFTRGMLNRFGHRGRFWDPTERYDIALGDTDMGYYMRALVAVKRNMLNIRNGAMYLQEEEKQAVFKVLAESLHILLNAILIRMLFGFDMDDDDKYEKLRNRSGPMQGLMVDEDNPAFHWDGFLANHALLILLKTKSNAESWIPLPGAGLDDYVQKLELKSAVYGQTFEAYFKILNMLIPTLKDEPVAFYKRDIGPYSFQKEGGSKLANYFFKSIGITGNNIDPNLAIRNYIQIEKKKAATSIFDALISNIPGMTPEGQMYDCKSRDN